MICFSVLWISYKNTVIPAEAGVQKINDLILTFAEMTK